MLIKKNPAGNAKSILTDLKSGIFLHEILENALLFKNDNQELLFELARQRRSEFFSHEQVEVRSVIEVSNICKQGCNYCTMGEKAELKNYTIDEPTLLALIDYLYYCNRRVFLFQSGENNRQDFIDMISVSIEKIKKKYPDCVILLCLGNLSREQYYQLRKAGADRYILKFETSNPDIYHQAKPNDTLEQRIHCMDNILECGFELGSGNITGLPKQTLTDIVKDLLFIHRYNLSMNSTTVFIPAETSVYRNEPHGDIDITLNAMALMRIMNPKRLMPTTGSLEKIQKGGQLKGLLAGANTVTVHDGTPEELKDFFPIYSINRVVPKQKHFEKIVTEANLKFNKEIKYYE